MYAKDEWTAADSITIIWKLPRNSSNLKDPSCEFASFSVFSLTVSNL